MNYAILLPARNEQEGLRRVLPACLALRPSSAVLVVDDGSTDETAGVARALGASVLRLSPGRGKGGALKAGFAQLAEGGFDAIATIDADGQHDPAAIPAFVDAMQTTGADLVIGARPTSLSAARRFANWASSGLLSLAAGQRVADAQSGFRLHRTALLASLPLEGEGFGFETAILTGALERGYRVTFVPIATIPARRPSHIHPIRDVAPMIGQHAVLAARMALARARTRRTAI